MKGTIIIFLVLALAMTRKAEVSKKGGEAK